MLPPVNQTPVPPSQRIDLRRFPFAAILFLVALITPAFGLIPTPSITEGPFYPFNSGQRLDTRALAKAGNDLTLVDGKTKRASGTRFLLSGTLVNTSGTAIAGAKIELWEADNNGVYYYEGSFGPPNDYADIDPNFQHYGTTVTDSTGAWSFRTIKPGKYEGRVRHFHYKVKINGITVLTSQFMFEEDRGSFADDMVTDLLVREGTIDLAILKPISGVDPIDDATALIAGKQIVVDRPLSVSAKIRDSSL